MPRNDAVRRDIFTKTHRNPKLLILVSIAICGIALVMMQIRYSAQVIRQYEEIIETDTNFYIKEDAQNENRKKFIDFAIAGTP